MPISIICGVVRLRKSLPGVKGDLSRSLAPAEAPCQSEDMSIVVDLDRLAGTLADYPYGYLLTSRKGAVKAVTVTASVVDGHVDIPVGSSGSARNLADNPTATLLFPPTAPGGYSLIVDGTASATARGFRLDPAKAVLHRPADHAADPGAGHADPADPAHPADPDPAHTHDSGCGHDCRPL